MARQGYGRQGLRPFDAAVATVVSEGHREILRFLQRRVGDGAEEVLQAFFAEVLGDDTHLPRAASIRVWLGQHLERASSECYRRRSAAKGAGRVRGGDVAAMVLPDEEFDAAVCACLYMLLPTLKPEYAEILWRADLAREPREHTAKQLGTTVNNVAVRLYRARSALRKRLEQMCLTCPTHGFVDCTCDYASTMRTVLAKVSRA